MCRIDRGLEITCNKCNGCNQASGTMKTETEKNKVECLGI